MKTKLILCFALFVAIFIGVSCGEASAQSKKDGHNKLADKGRHRDKDPHDGHRHDKDHDPKKEYDSLEKEIWAAVKEGKLSKRDAMEKLSALNEDMFGDHDRDHHHDKKDWDEKEKHEHEGHDMGKIMVAVEVLMHAVKTDRMEEHHAKDMLWEIFAGEEDHHREEHHRHHGEDHEREGHHHEEEHDREGRHHEEEHHRHHGEEHHREGRHHREGGEEALYETVARGLQAAVELGKMSKEEAKEVWRDMTEGDDEEE